MCDLDNCMQATPTFVTWESDVSDTELDYTERKEERRHANMPELGQLRLDELYKDGQKVSWV